MQSVVTVKQMQAIEQETIQNDVAIGYSFMLHAALGVVKEIAKLHLDPHHETIAILCGRGKNGGDGFVVGRILVEKGYHVTCFGITGAEELQGEARLAYEEYHHCGGPIFHVTDHADVGQFQGYTLIIDALLGTGGQGNPRGIIAELIRATNNSPAFVISIDTPSGLDATTAIPMDPTIEADLTISLGFPKIGQLFFPGRYFTGELLHHPLHFPYEIEHAHSDELYLPSKKTLATLLPPRNPEGHKYTFGTVVGLCGSKGMLGAATLAAQSAMSAGCGMYVALTPESQLLPLSIKLTEPVLVGCPETSTGSFAQETLSTLNNLPRKTDVLLVGPGCGRDAETLDLLRECIKTSVVPMVIDGDALFALAGHSHLLTTCKGAILTPHYGEWRTLFGELSSLPTERCASLQEVATTYGITVLLKGAPTLVATPDGACSILPVGTSGMATAGSGDVLAGIIAGLVAQGAPLEEAALLGVALHGYAGEVATEQKSEYALLASDIIAALPTVFKEFLALQHT